MQKVKKVLGIILNVVLWSLLAISTLLVVSLSFIKLKGGQPALFGVGFYQIITGSMEPEIRVGDVVIAKKVSFDELEVGDNLVFTYNSKTVTHKLIKINDNKTLVTHGVANPEGSNEVINFSQVIGRQVFRLPYLGYALDFMRSPFGYVFIIILPLGGLIIYQTVVLGKRLKKYKQEGDGDEQGRLRAEIDELKAKLEAKDEADVGKDEIDDEKDGGKL